MAQRITPSTKIKIVPKEGELEITLNVNITVDGQVVATANNANVVTAQQSEQSEEDDDHVDPLVPDFSSGGGGIFGMFGKKSNDKE